MVVKKRDRLNPFIYFLMYYSRCKYSNKNFDISKCCNEMRQWGISFQEAYLFFTWASLVTQTVEKSACNAGDPGSIPGSERSPGERNGNPLQWTEEPGGVQS